MSTETLLNLKIHKVTDQEFAEGINQGSLDTGALYLTPDDGSVEVAERLSTEIMGDANTPVYFSEGKPVACTGLDLDTSGNAATASKLETKRKIKLTGDVTGEVDFDGSTPVELTATVVDDSHTHNNSYYTKTQIDELVAEAAEDISEKANKDHASSTTTYGVSSEANYGHAKASTTTPKANGTANVGSETSSFARGDHVHPLGSAASLATSRTIDGVSFDGTSSITHYGECSTPGGDQIKTVTISGFKLVTGAKVFVNFTQENTAGSPKLSVSGTSAYPITYQGEDISGGVLAANNVYEFIYLNGTYEIVDGPNSGVRSIAPGRQNGTISVNHFGTASDVAVKGLGSAAYQNSNAFAEASHSHSDITDRLTTAEREILSLGSSLSGLAPAKDYQIIILNSAAESTDTSTAAYIASGALQISAESNLELTVILDFTSGLAGLTVRKQNSRVPVTSAHIRVFIPNRNITSSVGYVMTEYDKFFNFFNEAGSTCIDITIVDDIVIVTN